MDDWNEIALLFKQGVEKKRRYAAFWDWPDKPIKESGIAAALLEAAPDLVRFEIGSVHSQTPDPPDCVATDVEGRKWGIEVTELVDQAAVEIEAREESSVWATWDKAKLIDRLESMIVEKDNPAAVHGGPYAEYLLLIHTAEPELSIELARSTLAEKTFPNARLITRAYLLMAYDPSTQNYPVFRLSLGQ